MLRVYESIGDLFLTTLAEHGSREYLKWRDEVGQVHALTYQQVEDRITTILAGLLDLGCARGEHLAICSETRPEWIVVDVGILCMGAVTVTIYPTLRPAQVQYILADSQSKIIFVDELENLKKVLAVWDDLPGLDHIVVFDELSEKMVHDLDAPLDRVHTLADLERRGQEYLEARNDDDTRGFLEDKIHQVQEMDLASIIYTSGTTGVPKGVMLSHRNFLSNAIAASEIIKQMNPDEPPHEQNSLTFMPLSHSYCRTAEEFVAMLNGACLCFAGGRSPALIETGFKVFQPSLMAGIPYVFEKIYNTIFRKIHEYPDRLRKLFFKGLEFGKKYNEIVAAGKKPSLGKRIHHWIDKKLIYKRVHEQLGGRLTAFCSGSARLSPEIARTFWALDIKIIDGYGLTEATPITHVQRTLENCTFRPDWPPNKKIHPLAKLGSVGPPIEFPGNPYPNVQCKIADDGEVLIKGPNVMMGYWQKPEETKRALDPDGWLHTGDVGRIDEDGYLFLTGRKRNIFKLSTGKMISPPRIEDRLVLSPLVLQALVVGSEKKYLTAFVVPDQTGIKDLAKERNLPVSSYQELLANAAILAALKASLLEQSKDLARYETVKKFAVFAQEFGEDEGYLTPTMKFKRDKILTDFGDIRDQLYEIEDDWFLVDRRLVDFHELTIPG